MKRIKFIKPICCILIAFLCIFCLQNVVNADLKSTLDGWKPDTFVVHRYKYKSNGEDQYRYAIELGDAPTGLVETPQGRYIYQETDENGNYVSSTEVSVVGKLTVPGVNKGASIKCTGVVSTTGNGMMLVLDGVEFKNGRVYINGQPKDGLDEKDFIKNMKMDYELQVGGTTVTTKEDVQHKDENAKIHGQSWLDKLKDLLNAIKSFIKDALSYIFSRIFLIIGSGIRALIDSIDGFSQITIAKIVYNHCNKVTIDFWNIANDDKTSIAGILKPVVSFWYSRFRAIAILCYLILLLYAGVRLIITNKADSMEKIKQRLSVWLSGVVILFLFPYVMKYTIRINNLVVKKIESEVERVTATEFNEKTNQNIDTMAQVYNMAVENDSIPLSIIYIMLLGQLILLLILYYKRAFMVAFLITFFPIVCIKHVFEGINSGGTGRALGAWTKEFMVLVFTQLLHALVYGVLIDGASSVFLASSSTEAEAAAQGGDANVILYALFVAFLFKAEAIAKSIFQIESRNGMLFDMSRGGAAALAFGKQAVGGLKDTMSSRNSAHDKEDRKQEKKFSNKRTQLEETQSKNKQTSREMDKDKKVNATRQSELSEFYRQKEREEEEKQKIARTLQPANLQNGDQGQESGSEGNDDYNAGDQIDKAQAVLGEEALEMRNGTLDFRKGHRLRSTGRLAGRLIKGAAGMTIKGAAMGVGLAAGAASGDMTKGLTYGISLAKTTSLATNAVGRTVDWAGRKAKATYIKKQINKPGSKINKQLQDAGVDTEALFNSQKGEIIRKALAEYASGMVRGGNTLADNKFTHEIVSEDLSTVSDEKITKDKN